MGSATHGTGQLQQHYRASHRPERALFIVRKLRGLLFNCVLLIGSRLRYARPQEKT